MYNRTYQVFFRVRPHYLDEQLAAPQGEQSQSTGEPVSRRNLFREASPHAVSPPVTMPVFRVGTHLVPSVSAKFDEEDRKVPEFENAAEDELCDALFDMELEDVSPEIQLQNFNNHPTYRA